jgi:hypothetical protein
LHAHGRAVSSVWVALNAAVGDVKLLQVRIGYASVMVTAHIHADLYESDLDRVDALDGLGG